MKQALVVFIGIFMFSTTLNAQSTHENPMAANTVIGFVKIPDIDGESQSKAYAREIEIYGLASLSEQLKSAQTGSGRSRARATVSPISLVKKIDAATPYLMLANLQGKFFPETTISLVNPESESQNPYLVITLKNVLISKHQIDASSNRQEIIDLKFDKITVKYITKSGVNEISYNLATGI
ncbi:type VI secretion system tube protein Hcp [Algibacter amylolyticus]|uniref:Type VI secretion system tube protein Hcp n=1 Tax=Algibacter amylolyticus TaxID=1608400 RepID=A0A5M7BA08_9FLAO|nr:type VI secretion system tube protein Hcp [Algibacter amylolyticus]KAA5826386.1 type VI secretion system tube protein Hcp [Algibacter amylolyticus]MBB5268592.1 type VI secretion system secreted protein Hcp [Algibacter amylolyticus]TSJ80424.1 type VI secretion system tube protein Hcp [Algibacter amylolyticus]